MVTQPHEIQAQTIAPARLDSLPPDRRSLKAAFEACATCNVSSRRRPEFLQLCGFITVLISPIQLSFDSMDFVLLWQRYSVVDVSRDLSVCPGEGDLCVEIEPALLQLVRAPVLINAATMAPYVRRVSVPCIRISARHRRTGRGRGLVCAANQSNGKRC